MNEWIVSVVKEIKEFLEVAAPWLIKITVLATSVWIFIKKIWPWAKGLWEVGKKIKYLQNEEKHSNLRLELLSVKEQLHAANEKNAKLEEQLKIKDGAVWKDGILYYNNAEICSRCFDTSSSTDRKTVRLLPSDHEIKGVFYCPECKIHPKTTEGAIKQLENHREAARFYSSG